MVRTKVFVGNLSFQTKENELAKEFEAAGKVISANIITRGPRSLGYGFVEMDNEVDAQNAVKLLDKKEIDGRPINVEVAKPREEGVENQGQQQNNNQGNQRSSRGGRGGRGGFANRGAPRNNNSGAPRQNQNQQQGQQQNQQQNQQQGQQGGRRPRQPRAPRESDDQNEGQRRPRQPRAPRNARPEGEADTRTPSKTTLFVANLPFAITDETFAKVLKDASLPFKQAHVVQKKTGRSKGFGFIDFDSEADQQRALAALDNKDVEGRPLAVKVALISDRATENNQSSSTTSAPATTTSAPAPTKNTTPINKTTSPAPTKNSSAPTKTTQPAEKKEEKPATPKQEKK